MPEYLMKRNGAWQFVRRVPHDLSHLDRRQNVKQSTGVRVADDRHGTKAGKIADEMNRELEAYWRGLLEGKAQEASLRYNEARRRARTFGYDYVETPELASPALRTMVEVLERLEKLEKLMTPASTRARRSTATATRRPMKA